ncbi:MAG: zf-HC2 domain-containing protein [Elusimicrobia bacterium]|nr:zf-HC2 domain-containing protein [Elusimicrobiota bacterium]
MTKCDPYKKLIQRALDGVLPALEGEGLSRHLATCAECRAEQAVMGRIQRLVVRTGTLPEGADVGPHSTPGSTPRSGGSPRVLPCGSGYGNPSRPWGSPWDWFQWACGAPGRPSQKPFHFRRTPCFQLPTNRRVPPRNGRGPMNGRDGFSGGCRCERWERTT